MTQRSPRNTRKHRRMTVRILVDYQVRGGIHCDYATTLGAGGMLLQTDLDLLRGEIVKVRFRVPGRDNLFELEARVTWAHAARKGTEDRLRMPEVGLQFTDRSAVELLARELEDYASD